jgi:hypothetical protein
MSRTGGEAYASLDEAREAKAAIMAKRPTFASSSHEADILRQIEELIRKLAAGEASPSDMQLLYELQKRRVDLMEPTVPSGRMEGARLGRAV